MKNALASARLPAASRPQQSQPLSLLLIRWCLLLLAILAMSPSASAVENAARFVSQTVPSTMTAGGTYNVSVTMENSGTAPWTVGEEYKLGSQSPQDNMTWGGGRVLLASAVSPGKQHTFTFPVTAPHSAGTYDFQWRMLKESVEWFGEQTPNAPVSIPVAAGGTTTFFHNDVAGTPLIATDARGAVVWKENYRPSGERIDNTAASRNNKLWFTGKPHDDNTGLIYMSARYYDPLLGRFVGVDPAAFDPANSHSFNRYAYANNNPYAYVDPDGHSPLDVVFLVADLGKLGVAMYSGVGVGAAMADVAMSVVGVASPIPFAGQAIKAARAAEHGIGMLRGADKVADAARAAENATAAAAKKIHGNSHSTTKPAQGYTLRDADTEVVLKYGETTRGTSRYSDKFLERNNAVMYFEAAGTKKEMHQWQHQKILEYKELNTMRPPMNKSDW